MKGLERRITWTVALIALSAPHARAGPWHDGVHTQIEKVSVRIEQDPGDARLYLKRGELHRLHGEPERGLLDFDRAVELAPSLDVVAVARTRALIDLGRLAQARATIGPYLDVHPRECDALELRARIATRQGRHADAERDWSSVVAHAAEPGPDAFLERARAARARGAEHVPRALRGLDEGLERLGDLPTLQLYAIELELDRRAYDAALARLERVARTSQRQERWLAREGDILVLAGRRAAAECAYRGALEAMDRLPRRLSATRTVQELRAHVQRALADLAHPGSPPSEQGTAR